MTFALSCRSGVVIGSMELPRDQTSPLLGFTATDDKTLLRPQTRPVITSIKQPLHPLKEETASANCTQNSREDSKTSEP